MKASQNLPIQIKQELIFFLKSVVLVILLIGLLTVMALSIFHGDVKRVDAHEINTLLGGHLYWIKAVAILTATMILLPDDARKDAKKIMLTALKVLIYYLLASFSFVAAQYLYIIMT